MKALGLIRQPDRMTLGIEMPLTMTGRSQPIRFGARMVLRAAIRHFQKRDLPEVLDEERRRPFRR